MTKLNEALVVPGANDCVVPPPASREQLRSRRRWPLRATTISISRTAKRDLVRQRVELEILEELDPMGPVERPRTRGDCANGARPCPFVTCRHHLYLDVAPRTGAIKLNRPDIGPESMVDSCTLDVADRGGLSLDGVGAVLNITRERVRQLELLALSKLEPTTASLRQEYGLPSSPPRRRHGAYVISNDQDDHTRTDQHDKRTLRTRDD